jgi:alcohol dehydrogenase class IV
MDFFMPTRLYTGADCLAAHADEFAALGDGCLIVTDQTSARSSGALADVSMALSTVNVSSAIWDSVTPNPQLASCMEAARFAHTLGCDFILGIGGGSALDAAKAVAVLAANPDLTEDAFYAKEWGREPLPIALVGTTAGTGSEVTKVSVLTDSAARKHSIHDDRLYARVSFGDPRHTSTCSQPVTLTCGVDVLAHATEAYFSRKADEISRAFSVRAVRLAWEPLTADSRGEQLSADERCALYEASILGGLAINTCGTCFPHNVGYYLTENYGVPH